MKNKKAFTLIELVSVLVILAILALIVTPLVLNIIKKARTAADKRSIDAYGRSIELAIADYLLDNGTFPTSIDQLNIEYSGDRIECANKGINEDATIYLTDCTLNGRAVTGYAYGTDKLPTYQAYSIGDEITYNGVDYYVIKNSGIKESSVTLLKATPLTVAEVNTYGGVGTANNHVNMYNSDSSSNIYQTSFDSNGYGGMAYYSSANCGYGEDSNYTDSGCITDYVQSEIKYVVDSWKLVKAPIASEARLVLIEDLVERLGYEYYEEGTTTGYRPTEISPVWIYNENYQYWTMNAYNDSKNMVWTVRENGNLLGNTIGLGLGDASWMITVRPVIVLPKSALN